MNAAESGEASILDSTVPRGIAVARFATGLVQGVLLYVLYQAVLHQAWPATDPRWFAPLFLTTLYVPVLAISSMGHVERRRVLLWMLLAIVLVSTIAFYGMWRAAPDGADVRGFLRDAHSVWPPVPVFVFTAWWLFIAHSLTLAASADRCRIARYPTYFETAWKLAVQLIFSALFVGVLWLVLWLGASLFMLVQLDFLKELLAKDWFWIPVTAFAFSSGMHLTDVRPGIVRGIRTLLLVLMSWLLPLATVIVLGFLLSLPWTGLAPLWATKHATVVLLGAVAVLVVLINATYQNGEISSQVAKVLRLSGRLAALMLVPIVVIAIYSLGLRVGEYGWTTERILAAACLLIATSYAAGYALAALAREHWLRQVAPTNVFTAFLILVVLFSMLSPIADPARISVSNQLARLESGKVSAAKFDFDYLRFGGERYGWEALQKLKAYTQGTEPEKIREGALGALSKTYRWDTGQAVATADEVAVNVTAWPKGSSLPKTLFSQDWHRTRNFWTLPECLLNKGRRCDAFLMDFTGDGKTEVLLIGQQDFARSAILAQNEQGQWEVIGSLRGAFGACRPDLRKQLQAGSYRFVVPKYRDLEVAGQRLQVIPSEDYNQECLP